ncbi:hypothetical protein AXF42_Ash019569 [Apostasia shenzhenica]|uniref:Ribonuclease H1 N-terminal domain-containing protein n=1 Tax=Apostasia shenzhenica TaxID=1088818 RepID=A0A2I0AV39_9ASPA|nr:hypothetical protein AXF42_Ash019569 [Apostasia shenzhenica]
MVYKNIIKVLSYIEAELPFGLLIALLYLFHDFCFLRCTIGHRRGVYYRWEDYFAQVNRYPGALYFKVASRAEGERHLHQHVSRILQTSSGASTLSMTNLTVDQLHATSCDDTNVNAITAALLVGLLVGLALGPSRRIE